MPHQYELGVIHGRFQVLHLDHLKYLLDGKARCEHLVTGVTNPDPSLTRKDAADVKRSDPINNPLTYYERYWLVRAALTGAGLSHDAFSVTPLPINAPELYQYYVPMDAVFFVSVYDDWGRRKRDMFRDLGLKVVTLREVTPDQKGLSASDVRRAMALGEPWKHLVPEATIPLLEKWDVSGRMRSILAESEAFSIDAEDGCVEK